jgi:putative SOS response-associated peptidase YedK
LPVDGRKQPHFLCREDREPIWLAGIWSERPDGKPGCAILTEPARGVARGIHDRMPLALGAESLEPWLDSHLTDLRADLPRRSPSACPLAREYVGEQTAPSGCYSRYSVTVIFSCSLC